MRSRYRWRWALVPVALIALVVGWWPESSRAREAAAPTTLIEPKGSPDGTESAFTAPHMTPSSVVAMGPGRLMRDVARTLGRIGKQRKPIARTGQPRGGKRNAERIHTETYGKGHITGREKEWGQMTPAEREFAQQLASAGYRVRLVPQRRDVQTPDFEVTGHGGTARFELTTLTSFGKSTVRRNIKDAIKQNPHFIIINCRNVPATHRAVVRQIAQAERDKKISLKGRLLVWMPDGTTLIH